MKLDRERFLALALSLAGCAHHGATSPVDEGARGDPGAWEDLGCTGIDLDASECVAWKKGKVKSGYLPTDECVRWDEAGNCNANAFVREGALPEGD